MASMVLLWGAYLLPINLHLAAVLVRFAIILA